MHLTSTGLFLWVGVFLQDWGMPRAPGGTLKRWAAPRASVEASGWGTHART